MITAGSNLDEAREMVAEALAFHLERMAQDGEAAPQPSSLEEIMPADVLAQIDEYAEREGFTRSGFLAQAAKKVMAA